VRLGGSGCVANLPTSIYLVVFLGWPGSGRRGGRLGWWWGRLGCRGARLGWWWCGGSRCHSEFLGLEVAKAAAERRAGGAGAFGAAVPVRRDGAGFGAAAVLPARPGRLSRARTDTIDPRAARVAGTVAGWSRILTRGVRDQAHLPLFVARASRPATGSRIASRVVGRAGGSSRFGLARRARSGRARQIRAGAAQPPVRPRTIAIHCGQPAATRNRSPPPRSRSSAPRAVPPAATAPEGRGSPRATSGPRPARRVPLTRAAPSTRTRQRRASATGGRLGSAGPTPAVPRIDHGDSSDTTRLAAGDIVGL
jgi:hypothetical protein